MGFFEEFFLKNHLPHAYYFRIWLMWLDSFDYKKNSVILIKVEMVRLVSSDKWKAPLA